MSKSDDFMDVEGLDDDSLAWKAEVGPEKDIMKSNTKLIEKQSIQFYQSSNTNNIINENIKKGIIPVGNVNLFPAAADEPPPPVPFTAAAAAAPAAIVAAGAAPPPLGAKTADRVRRTPLILYAVLDTSSSMRVVAGGLEAEADELSRLDLVKHSMSTLIAALTEEDQICIIQFSTTAKILAPLTALTVANKRELQTRLWTDLQPDGQTNILAGLLLAVDQIAELPNTVSSGANVQIYLLTDGEPTIHESPQSLQDAVESHVQRRLSPYLPRPVVNTFGYGYQLDSKLLYDVARQFQGSFGYIPDSSMVGTVFINALANSLMFGDRSELFQSAEGVPSQAADLMVKYLRGVASPRSFSSSSCNSDGTTAADDIMASFNTTLSSLTVGTGFPTLPSLRSLNTSNTLSAPVPTAIIQELIVEIHNLFNASQGREDIPAETLPFLVALYQDCAPNTEHNLGQISKAVEPNYFNKWGKHYLLSVLSAYENRVCISFKDKGMQFFRTVRFIEEQARVMEIFRSLPPPVPSARIRINTRTTNGSSGGTASSRSLMHSTTSRAVSGMGRYLNENGGCFTAESLVITSNTENNSKTVVQQVSSLKKDSVVLSDQGMTTVEVVIKIRYTGSLYAVHGMVLTAYHPVLLDDGTPAFPCEIGQPSVACFDGYVYDVVLANRGILASPKLDCSDGSIGGVFYVATWGHTCKLPKFQHDYFGSEQIVHDLQQQFATSYYEAGYIVIEAPHFMRDEDTGLIVQLMCC